MAVNSNEYDSGIPIYNTHPQSPSPIRSPPKSPLTINTSRFTHVTNAQKGIDSVKVNENQSKFVINWIDSKAMFADETTFLEQLDQFRAYNHRYGRLVLL